jgi:hypothetical protein
MFSQAMITCMKNTTTIKHCVPVPLCSFKLFVSAFIMCLSLGSCSAGTRFDQLFHPKTLRLDWILAGDANTTHAYFSAFRLEPHWGGSRTQLIDSTGFGDYRVVLLDQVSGDTIYTRGFCTLFQEWQSTENAKQMQRAFEQSVQLPFPRGKAQVVIDRRNNDQSFSPILRVMFDPQSPDIIADVPVGAEVVTVEHHGTSEACVDLVFVAEGYTAAEQDKFIADVRRMSDYLFSMSPYTRYRQQFNIWAVKMVSPQSGTDNPRKNHWVSTPFHTGFNSLGIDRYLLTNHLFAVRNAAALAPSDQVVVLVNSPLYGGAGIFNHFLVVTSDHAESLPVFVHEFGHAFAGLADEYYTSEVSYGDFVDKTTEPWYPNITTLVNFNQKWKHRVDATTPVPTPNTPEWQSVIGVFEGAAYSEKGIYRPASNCRMMTNDAPGFCPVCEQTIETIIKQHTLYK